MLHEKPKFYIVMKKFFSLILALSATFIAVQSQNTNIKDTRQEELLKRATTLGQIDETTKIYLRGSVNKWGLTDPFTRVSEGVYVLENFILINGRDGWKIASEDWHTVDIGGFGTEFTIDGINKVKVGGDNIFISGIQDQQAIKMNKIVLDLNKMIITFEKSKRKYPHISLNYPTDTEFMTDEFTIVPSFNADVADGMMKIIGKNINQTLTIKDRQPIKIGQGESFETTIMVVTLAIASDGIVRSDTTIFYKTTPTQIYVYFNNAVGWEKPYCYLWTLGGDRNCLWPGEQMQFDSEVVIDGQKGWWKLQVTKRYADFGEVIFNNNATLQTNDDLSMEGTSMYYDGQNWKKVTNICQ